MLHRARPLTGLHRSREDIGFTSIETLLSTTAGLTGAAGVCFLMLRLKDKFDAARAGRPAPPLLPEVAIPWDMVGIAAGGLALSATAALIVVGCRALRRERQAEQRRRAALVARHDHVLGDLGARLIDDLTDQLLDDPVLFGALQEAQDARTDAAQDRYRAAVRTLETQWRATLAVKPAPTA